MRTTKLIFVCDICNQEVKAVESISMPIKESDCEGRTYHDAICSIDMCNDCKEKYMNTVFKHFGILRDTLGSLSFEPTKWNS